MKECVLFIKQMQSQTTETQGNGRPPNISSFDVYTLASFYYIHASVIFMYTRYRQLNSFTLASICCVHASVNFRIHASVRLLFSH